MFQTTDSIEDLREIARRVRIDALKALNTAKSGHTGGSLSAVEVLVTIYFSQMNHDPKNPSWKDRDRFIMYKGQGVPALYTVLAHSGYFPVEELMTLRKPGSRLQGHPEYDIDIGIEASTLI